MLDLDRMHSSVVTLTHRWSFLCPLGFGFLGLRIARGFCRRAGLVEQLLHEHAFYKREHSSSTFTRTPRYCIIPGTEL
jgi:hypothetical protein